MAQSSIDYKDARQYWPRKAALRIVKLDTRQEMLDAIDDVPEEFRQWVKDYLNDWVELAGGLANLKNQMEQEKLKRDNKY